MRRFRLAAFDLDGTLVDSAPDLAHCLGFALDSAGLRRPSLAEARSWIGDGVEALVRRGLEAALDGCAPEAALLASTLATFDRCYADNLFRESRLYPDVAVTMQGLRKAGIVLGCVTNKRERFARALLEAAGIDGELTFVFGGDTFPRRKPDPLPLLEAARGSGVDPKDSVMIGDSVHDRHAARDAGFAFVLAAYGYVGSGDAARATPDASVGAHIAAADPVSEAAPFAVIERFSDLGELLCGR